MAKFKFSLTIGYPTAMEVDTIEIDDSELVDLSPEDRKKYIQEALEEWAGNYVEMWYEEEQ